MLTCLSAERRKAIVELFERKRRGNVEIGIQDCLYFGDWMTILAKRSELRGQLNFPSRKQFERYVGAFDDLRNAVAHGRSILDGASPVGSLARVQRVRALADRVWAVAEAQDRLWEVYAATVIRRRRGRRVLAGAEAVDPWPYIEQPAHVITAWNPGGHWRSRAANRRANLELVAVLERDGHTPEPVVGTSPDETWKEDSFLVEGMARADAVALGARFGQLAIFEVDEGQVRVLRCEDGQVMASRERIR